MNTITGDYGLDNPTVEIMIVQMRELSRRGHSHILAIPVCAAGKGTASKPFSLV